MNHVTLYSDFLLTESVETENVHIALFEAFSQTLEKLEDAVTNKFVCRIDYRGEKVGDILDGIRIIEPVAVGVDTSGSYLLRAWLLRGVSKTGRANPRLVPGWRLFRLDRIRSLQPTLEKFRRPHKGFNADDSMMSEVLFSAKF
jgi:predicted DNA-binding transcriptional regulator YafY